MSACWQKSIVLGLVFLGAIAVWIGSVPGETASAQLVFTPPTDEPITSTLHSVIYLPYITANYNFACDAIPGASYTWLSVVNPHNPDAENDAGYNLGLLGYELTDAFPGLVDYAGEEDPNAPQFPYLFSDQRAPDFPAVYRLHHGNGEPVTDWPVTMLGMGVELAENLYLPESGYRIDPQGYQAMVIYASEERIALNYTRSDTLYGYTVYVENVCVEPSLLAVYRQLTAAGRTQLPALRGSQPFGRSLDSEIRLVIRDNGSAMDPRSRKDWWRGR